MLLILINIIQKIKKERKKEIILDFTWSPSHLVNRPVQGSILGIEEHLRGWGSTVAGHWLVVHLGFFLVGEAPWSGTW
jgi:hypothetical protein